MGPAEYRTLREACGLTLRDAAAFHHTAERTVAYWEAGRGKIPDGAEQELRGLNASIERGVQAAIDICRELLAEQGPATEVALTRYRTVADYAGSQAQRDGLPHPAHAALLGRTMLALERAGATVKISWGVDRGAPPDYEPQAAGSPRAARSLPAPAPGSRKRN